jgi:GcrA cell cycle regulator
MARIPFWDDRTIDLLVKLVADGNSAGTIGKELGISRNSVIGKAHRMGLSFGKGIPSMPEIDETAAERKERRKAAGKPSAPEPVRETPQPTRRTYPLASYPEPVEAAHEPPVAFHAPVPVGGYDLLDLRRDQCRYAITPHSAKVHRFCGEAVTQGKSYCEHHHAMCTTVGYVPVRMREAAE